MPCSTETASFMDPEISVEFYTKVLGMELISAYDHSNGNDSLETKQERKLKREGVLELSHYHGTESDPDFTGYANGNTDPRGFGHIAISVDNVEETCERFEKLAVTFEKRASEGDIKGIAFICDPDGYWIEIVPKEFLWFVESS
ncbi:hypothetical protein Clacol_000896 [Clathrus columnatus]|uniref:lactoylglutathione lyase n=1 Tax=Clathrus columnatus TaxID=1419009 RepID=A0AAV5A112_9AGAM|nr:hypothetical protein Clacol_000896 [Clathrus columnatus]